MVSKKLKNILSVLAIPILGFILLNLAFILDYLFQTALDSFVRLYAHIDINMIWGWYPPLKHFIFIILLGLLSRFIFKSKLNKFFKAVFLILPLAVIYLTIGMFLYPWPIASFLLALYFFLGTLYFLIRKKMNWLYFYVLILITAVMIVSSLIGVQI